MRRPSQTLLLRSMGNGAIMFVIVLVVFGSLSRHFFDPDNIVNIITQSSSLAIVAVGMTCTLLTAGIDLSVGSTMFVAAAVAAKLLLAECPPM